MQKYININLINDSEYTIYIPNRLYRWLFRRLFRLDVTTVGEIECVRQVLRER